LAYVEIIALLEKAGILQGFPTSYIALLDFISRRNSMYSTLPLAIAVLVSAGIIVIGYFYVAAPQRIIGGFGLKPPAADADTRAWLRLKGTRDITAGLAVLTLILTTDHRTVGIVLLVFAIIPFGDMSTVLFSGGRKVTAFSVHGLTCAVMLFAGFLLVGAF
jgi:hypothetical protein